MSSRDQILKAIRTNKGEARPLPEIIAQPRNTQNIVKQYKASLERNGGKFFEASSVQEINTYIKEQFPTAGRICSVVPDVINNVSLATIPDPHALNDVDVAVIKATVGVAENAANWLSEEAMIQRALPFITQHLILILEAKDIVPTMHEAYSKIPIDQTGYGVFIAGPSKTADIEQSLVIGAHGARSLSVFVL